METNNNPVHESSDASLQTFYTVVGIIFLAIVVVYPLAYALMVMLAQRSALA
jgi:hypothetical protein